MEFEIGICHSLQSAIVLLAASAPSFMLCDDKVASEICQVVEGRYHRGREGASENVLEEDTTGARSLRCIEVG